MDGLVIYGAGLRGQRVLELLRELKIEVKAVLDRDEQKIGTNIHGYIVKPPEVITIYQDALLYIAVADVSEQENIRCKLSDILDGVSPHEISYNELILNAFEKSTVIHDFLLRMEYSQNTDASALFCCPNGLVLGGIETWTLDLCDALLSEGKKNTYIIVKEGVDVAYELSEEVEQNILWEEINGFDVNTIKGLIQLMASKLPCKIITSQPDVMLLAAYLLKRACPDMVKIISVIHAGLEVIYNQYMSFRRCTDLYVAGSKGIQENMKARGINGINISYCPLPFPCPQQLDREYTLSEREPIKIGYAGRLDGMEKSQKRMDILLCVALELKKRGISFLLSIAGQGPAKEYMQAFVSNHSLEDHICFLGFLDRHLDLPYFWKRQDAAICMSDFEGRCLSNIEAMGNGAVPVVTDTSGAREDIIDGVNGYIVPIGDYMAAADRIEYLSHHRNKLPEMGKLAHDEVYPKSLMQPHVDFWKKILKG